MSSISIASLRERYPGNSDGEIADTLAEDGCYVAIVRYKAASARDFTDLGLCRSEQEVLAYMHSPNCQDVEIIYDARRHRLPPHTTAGTGDKASSGRDAPAPAGAAEPGSTASAKHRIPAGATRAYRNERFGFQMRFPISWEVVIQDEPAGSWIIPIAVAGPKGPDGRAAFSINVRQSEILNRNKNVEHVRFGPNGLVQDPRTPQEFITIAKSGLSFPDLRHESDRVLKVGGVDAAELVYTYSGKSSRTREITTTVFAVGVTFQFICEAPAQRFDEYRPAFQEIIDSFAFGRTPAGEAPTAEASDDVSVSDVSHRVSNGAPPPAPVAHSGCPQAPGMTREVQPTPVRDRTLQQGSFEPAGRDEHPQPPRRRWWHFW